MMLMEHNCDRALSLSHSWLPFSGGNDYPFRADSLLLVYDLSLHALYFYVKQKPDIFTEDGRNVPCFQITL